MDIIKSPEDEPSKEHVDAQNASDFQEDEEERFDREARERWEGEGGAF